MRKRLILFCCVTAFLILWVYKAGAWLVADSPSHSDALLILSGDDDDAGLSRGLDLLQQQYGSYIVLDENTDVRVYGFERAKLAQEFVSQLRGPAAGKVRVCTIHGTSFADEVQFANRCIEQHGAKRVLLVTSDYKTRRALSTFERMLPQYEWSAAASHNPKTFGERWWQHREWTKHVVTGWAELLWWELVDRWR